MIQNTPSGGSIDRSSLHATTGRIAAVATALLLVAFLVLSVSRAAFTASTANANNSITTDAFVTLRDNDNDVALFTVVDATPTDSFERCIHVQYEGSPSAGANDINLYVTDLTTGGPGLGNLAPYLNVDVDVVRIDDDDFADPAAPDCDVFEAEAGATGVYDGLLSAFGTDYDGGATAFPAPDPDEIATYAFKVTIDVANVAAASTANAGWSFVWETNDAP